MNWTILKMIWSIGKDTASGPLSQLGTPQVIVRAYALAMLVYIFALVWAVVCLVTAVATRDITWMSYPQLYLVAATFVALPVIIIALRHITPVVWRRRSGRITGAMLLCILFGIVPFVAPYALAGTMPTYCTRYVQVLGGETFVPKEQLTAEDCFSTTLQPLDKSKMVSCATYTDQTGPNTYSQRPEVCQAGSVPPPRSASTPQ